MRIFRWLVVVSVVTGTIVGAVELYITLFVNPWSFAASAGASGRIPASQLPGQTPLPMIFLAIETANLLVALLSGAMYSRTSQRGWQIALWVAAIVLLLPSVLAAFSFFPFFFFVPTLLPAAILMFLAALFSLGVRVANGEARDASVESQPLIQQSSRDCVARENETHLWHSAGVPGRGRHHLPCAGLLGRHSDRPQRQQYWRDVADTIAILRTRRSR